VQHVRFYDVSINVGTNYCRGDSIPKIRMKFATINMHFGLDLVSGKIMFGKIRRRSLQ
jgi:hypothetical protein